MGMLSTMIFWAPLSPVVMYRLLSGLFKFPRLSDKVGLWIRCLYISENGKLPLTSNLSLYFSWDLLRLKTCFLSHDYNFRDLFMEIWHHLFYSETFFHFEVINDAGNHVHVKHWRFSVCVCFGEMELVPSDITQQHINLYLRRRSDCMLRDLTCQKM